ncbi:hypothetical protein Slala02_52700 [Streptomyces lavendulae subsp. lavendulae]|nr:hypothetical protein Slala01_05870 [Streptomyces lavendulae subsp. lavendulae]GLX29450.1 hypothetical protein Slala02_52700 [Streptomyces lavendulae subsp. lavendulae]
MSRLYPAIVPGLPVVSAASWVRATAAPTIPGSTSPEAGLASPAEGEGAGVDARAEGPVPAGVRAGLPSPGLPVPPHPLTASSSATATTPPRTPV